MAGRSIVHLLVASVVASTYFGPIVEILNKAGYSGWGSPLLLAPIVDSRTF